MSNASTHSFNDNDNELSLEDDELSFEDKRELLLQLLLEKDEGPETWLPISHNQKALWFLSHLDPEATAYNLLYAMHSSAPLQRATLEKVLYTLGQRYPILTATCSLHDSKPVLQLHPDHQILLEEFDASALSMDALRAQLIIDGNLPIDLGTGPLVRIKLYRCADNKCVLALIAHHIIVDFWSMDILANEILALYTAKVSTQDQDPLPQPGQQHSEFMRWQNEMLASTEGEQHWTYWKQVLSGELPILQLPLDRPRPPRQTYEGVSHYFVIDPELVQRLRILANSKEVTLFTLMLTAYQTLLFRYTHQEDIIIGTPALGRTAHPAWLNVIDYLANTVLIRSNLTNDPTFQNLLAQTQQDLMNALDHQDYPFSLLVERLQPQRDPSYSPLYQTLFIWNRQRNRHSQEMKHQGLDNLTPDITQENLSFEPFVYGQQGVSLDLNMTIFETDDGLSAELRYNIDLFDASTIARMEQHFIILLNSIAAQPEQQLLKLPMLSAQEQQQLLIDGNATTQPYPDMSTLHQLIEAQVARTPHAPAVVFEGQSRTFQQINNAANHLATQLQELGAGPDVLIGICMERSMDMMIALLAILKSGSAYLPLDPGYPSQRIAFIIQDSQVPLLLTQSHLQPLLPDTSARLICLQPDWEQLLTHVQIPNPVSATQPDHLAYIIYTSGSTGKPKGVQIPHHAVINLLTAMRTQLNLQEHDRLLAVTTLSFDIAALELFLPLIVGARVILLSREMAMDGAQLAQQIETTAATFMQATPVSWHLLLNAGWQGAPTLNMLCGGEALSAELADQLLEKGASLWNMYGPTETTIWSAVQHVTAERETICIGPPIANTQIYLLNPAGQPVPIGVPGELYIGGAGLARGYHSRPELTAQRFLPHPFSQQPGSRLYRTGDLARFREDGSIEYIARIDQQIKFHGHRIELGEIETALLQHPDIREAVVLVQEESSTDKRLVAYLVTHHERELSVEEIRGFLQEQVPYYMVPAHFLLLPQFPTTANGKLDRNALPMPSAERPQLEVALVAPRSGLENALASAWIEVLHLSQVGIHDNFFALGGDSILSMQIIWHAAQAGIHLSPHMIFEHQTIAQLAAALNSQNFQLPLQSSPAQGELVALAPIEHWTPSDVPLADLSQKELDALILQPQAIEDIYRLSPLQEGLLFHSLYKQAQGTYVEQFECSLQEPLDLEAFQNAWQQMIAHHTILRSSFHWQNLEHPVQIVHRQVQLPWRVLDWRVLNQEEQERKFNELQRIEREQDFELTAAPLMRVIMIRLDEQETRLLWYYHHIVLDGWSLPLLFQELLRFYQQHDSEEVVVQVRPYRDYIAWLQQQEPEGAADFWKKYLAGFDTPTLISESHRERAHEMPNAYNMEQIQLSASLMQQLQTRARSEKVTLNTLLQGMWAIMLARFSGQEDVLFGTTFAGRPAELIGVEHMIGLFINTLPTRVKINMEQSLSQWLGFLHRQQSEVQTYAHVSLTTIQGYSQIPHEQPLFECLFIFENYPLDVFSESQESQLRVSKMLVEEYPPYPLTLIVNPQGNSFNAMLYYDSNRFELATIMQLLTLWQELLQALIEVPTNARLLDLPMLSAQERQQLIIDSNATTQPYPDMSTLHQLIEAQVARTPHVSAVMFEGQSRTFQQINNAANHLAAQLQEMGAGPDILIGICMERSFELMIAVLAILKSGSGYLSLDPSYPSQRLIFVLQDCQVPLLITQSHLQPLLPDTSARLICLQPDWEQSLAHVQMPNPVSATLPDHLAYVLYTSGSTGQPKGVMVPHRGLVNYLHWASQTYVHSAGSGAPLHSSISFDLTVTSLFVPLLTGECVWLLPEGESQGIATLANTLDHQQNFSLLKVTPSHLEALNTLITPEDLAEAAKVVIIGGEALYYERLSLWRSAAPGTRLINEYGPTETVVGCSVYEVAEDDLATGAVPIGYPIANMRIYLLDAYQQPVPLGAIGEIYVGGVGVTRGYHNRPELTAERFVPDPFSQDIGERLYRTGDLARYRRDGCLEYLARGDQQVKLRGYRIELGEIEAVLGAHPAIRDCVVLLRDEPSMGKRLVAYMVGQPDQVQSLDEVRNWLQVRVPAYMLPSSWVWLDAFPLTSNGKVDRRALPEPDQIERQVTSKLVLPQTPLQEQLALIWSELLHSSPIGIHDNFFALGGHSLLVIRLVTRIQNSFEVTVPIRSLFTTPTIAEMEQLIKKAQIEQIQLTFTEQSENKELELMLADIEGMSDDEMQALLDDEE